MYSVNEIFSTSLKSFHINIFHIRRIDLEGLAQKQDFHIANLDAAFTIISKGGILYEHLTYADKRELLRQMIKRVIVNTKGIVQRLDLLPPFLYLSKLSESLRLGICVENTKTSKEAGLSSELVLHGDHNRTQLEPILSRNTLEFTQSISFPQQDKLKRLSLQS